MSLDMSYKVVVHFDRRPDGGCRAWSEDVPGLTLSSADIDGMISDIPEALRVILSHMLGSAVTVSPLGGIREALEANGIVSPSLPVKQREYVAYRQ